MDWTRRGTLKLMSAAAAASIPMSAPACRRAPAPQEGAAAASGGPTGPKDVSGEEYVWVSANALLPQFVAHDHRALMEVARELGVRATIAGPNSVDIPGLVAALEQTVARQPTGIMVVGWDPSALVHVINQAVTSGIPVVCVDADVPESKRLAFIGTDWYELGVQQGRAMLAALAGRKGKVAMFGLIEQYIDQQAFAGFRSVLAGAGLEVLPPQNDKANQAEAVRITTAMLQAVPGLVGIAGFDSQSGPGIGLALREARKIGKVVGTSVDAEDQHLALLKEGALSALIMQKRELFTYYGVKALFDYVHTPVRFTSNDKQAGISPIPTVFSIGTCTITRENLHLFLS